MVELVDRLLGRHDSFFTFSHTAFIAHSDLFRLFSSPFPTKSVKGPVNEAALGGIFSMSLSDEKKDDSLNEW
jgi:hypothetical protein